MVFNIACRSRIVLSYDCWGIAYVSFDAHVKNLTISQIWESTLVVITYDELAKVQFVYLIGMVSLSVL